MGGYLSNVTVKLSEKNWKALVTIFIRPSSLMEKEAMLQYML